MIDGIEMKIKENNSFSTAETYTSSVTKQPQGVEKWGY